MPEVVAHRSSALRSHGQARTLSARSSHSRSCCPPGFVHVAARPAETAAGFFGGSADRPDRVQRDCTLHPSGNDQVGRDESGRLPPASAPTVSGLHGPHQRGAQLPQLGGFGALVERCDDILRGAAHLIDPVRQLGRLHGREHHRVGRQAGRRADRRTLFVGTLSTGLPAVPAPTTQTRIRHVAAAPAARLRSHATGHADDFNRLPGRIPV